MPIYDRKKGNCWSKVYVDADGFLSDQITRDKLKLNGKKAQGPKAQGSFELYFGRTNAAHCPETLWNFLNSWSNRKKFLENFYPGPKAHSRSRTIFEPILCHTISVKYVKLKR